MGYNYNGKLKSAEVLLTEDGEETDPPCERHRKIILQPSTALTFTKSIRGNR